MNVMFFFVLLFSIHCFEFLQQHSSKTFRLNILFCYCLCLIFWSWKKEEVSSQWRAVTKGTAQFVVSQSTSQATWKLHTNSSLVDQSFGGGILEFVQRVVTNQVAGEFCVGTKQKT